MLRCACGLRGSDRSSITRSMHRTMFHYSNLYFGAIMSKKLEGKIALVSGGSSGIGLATAERFVAEGAHVYITGRRSVELEASVRKIGRNVTAVQGDASKLPDLDRLFAQIKREKGGLDTIF